MANFVSQGGILRCSFIYTSLAYVAKECTMNIPILTYQTYQRSYCWHSDESLAESIIRPC